MYPRLPNVGLNGSTLLPDMDFETYSEAGYVWHEDVQKWKSLQKGNPGIFAVNSPTYAEHPSTEILFLAYNLKDGTGAKLWTPDDPPPVDLFLHIRNGLPIEAHNDLFEYFIWNYVAVVKLGWPPLPYTQLYCSMAKCRAWAIPGKLEKAGAALGLTQQKDKRGAQLIKLLSCPRTPTKNNSLKRLTRHTDPALFKEFGEYCSQDIVAEAALSAAVPDLYATEYAVFMLDKKINANGVYIDAESLYACIDIVEQAKAKYTAELRTLTGGAVQTVDELDKIKAWLGSRGVNAPSIDVDGVIYLLSTELPPAARRVLEIRQILGSRSVQKLYAIQRTLNRDSRVRDLFGYCGADRTGRFAGQGAQPQNLPGKGMPVRKCETCSVIYSAKLDFCLTCGTSAAFSEPAQWSAEAVELALSHIRTRNLSTVETIWGDPIDVIGACLRGLFSAPPGRELICSDFSAIEAVVCAMISGEQWRIDVFRTHGKIYEASLSSITGIPLEEILQYRIDNGVHHPLRKRLGKIAELSSAYQGSVGAWKAFGADEYMDDEEILVNVKKWRAASPAIVALWKGLEACAKAAIRSPGTPYSYSCITYIVKDNVLYCVLPSGRSLAYHKPSLMPYITDWGKEAEKILYWGHNSNYKKGAVGWLQLDTYGGKLTENVCQAIGRDLQTSAMLGADAAGFDIVLHVHDEIVTEVDEGTRSIEELEGIMGTMPAWAHDWPIAAAGGWRGKRYRKD